MPQNSSCTATNHVPQRPSTLNEQGKWDSAGGARTEPRSSFYFAPLHTDI